MGLLTNFKAQKALMLQSKGQIEEAEKKYEELIKEGLNNARFLLAYSVLLLRKNNFEKAKEIILKAEKAPDLSSDQRKQVYVNYATCIYKLGEVEKALRILENENNRNKSGLIYQTLGFLYVDAGKFEKAEIYLKESLEYDDEDPIILDNIAQFYFRKPNPDKSKAKEYFNKALEIRPNQIDTLYFLAKFDLEDGKNEDATQKLNKALEGNFSPLNYATKEKINKILERL